MLRVTTVKNQISDTSNPRRNMHRFLSIVRHANRSSSASSLPSLFEASRSVRGLVSSGTLRSQGSSESASLYKCFSGLPQRNELHARGFSSMSSGWNTLNSNVNPSQGFNPDYQRSVNPLSQTNSETKTSSTPMDFVRRIIETDGKNVGGAEFSGYNLDHEHDVVHIKLLRNNTFVTVTDSKGNVKLKSSVGCLKDMKGGQKLARYAAEATAEEVGRRSRVLGLKSVVIKVKGFTYFKKKRQAIESWREGFTNSRSGRSPIVCVEDATRIPHNGCRRPKKRRI